MSKLPKEFIVISMIFLILGLVLWFLTAIPVLCNTGPTLGLFITPSVILVLFLSLLLQLAKSRPSDEMGGDEYGIFAGLQNKTSTDEVPILPKVPTKIIDGVIITLIVLAAFPCLLMLYDRIFPFSHH
jgi:uncharacterized protein YacL